MIIVDVKLVPHGDHASPSTQLCRMHIVNDGTGTIKRGNYYITLYSKGDNPRIIKQGRITDWSRNSKPAWRLIAKAFEILNVT